MTINGAEFLPLLLRGLNRASFQRPGYFKKHPVEEFKEPYPRILVSNTTIARPATLTSPLAKEQGGLSGAPLFEPSTRILCEMRRRTTLPLIGVGGIASGAGAYAKIRAGASLVQLYSALAYEGPDLVTRIKRELLACMARDGFAKLTDAIGADAH